MPLRRERALLVYKTVATLLIRARPLLHTLVAALYMNEAWTENHVSYV